MILNTAVITPYDKSNGYRTVSDYLFKYYVLNFPQTHRKNGVNLVVPNEGTSFHRENHIFTITKEGVPRMGGRTVV